MDNIYVRRTNDSYSLTVSTMNKYDNIQNRVTPYVVIVIQLTILILIN